MSLFYMRKQKGLSHKSWTPPTTETLHLKVRDFVPITKLKTAMQGSLAGTKKYSFVNLWGNNESQLQGSALSSCPILKHYLE